MARLTIGLTGGIASGKSTAARRFIELGVPVIDADESARLVVALGSPGLAAVTHAFGKAVLTPQGELDRPALRHLIFGDAQRRHELEAILHPLIRADMDRRAAAAPGPYVVFAIPLLVESGARGRVDRTLVVDVEEGVQLARMMQRDGGSLTEARAILAAQATRENRLQAADDVLLNSGTVSELRQAVDALHAQYLRLAAAKAASADHFT